MQRKINATSDTRLWLERIAWNAAAGAVLAIMILILLGSLRLLETVAPATVGARPTVSASAPNEPAPAANESKIEAPIPIVDTSRPSG